MISPIEGLEERLGHKFRDRTLLVRALTHRSWLSEQASPMPEIGDNEQLEFLGDAVLGFIVSEALVLANPTAREGQLSLWKAHLVSRDNLHRRALELNLGEYLRLGRGEERNGGRERKTLLSNALEAVIAAMHLDGGLEVTQRFVRDEILSQMSDPDIVEAIASQNHKSVLQEMVQTFGLPPPRYLTIATSGPEHAKIFTVEVRVGDQLTSRASGSSKKTASQQAAKALVEEFTRRQNILAE